MSSASRACQQDAAADRGECRIGVQRGDGTCQRGGVGELGIVVEAEDDAAMAKRRTAIAPAGDAVVAVERHQRCILSPGDDGGEPRQVLGPRTLIDDEDMARHAGLCQRRADRRHGLLGAIERQDHHIGIVRRQAVGRRHRRCDASSLVAADRWDRQIGQPLHLLAARAQPARAPGRRRRTATSQHQSGRQQRRGQPRHQAAVQELQHDRQAETETGGEQRAPVSPNDCSGRSCFTSIMMVRRMRSPSETVCSLERDPAARPRYCVDQFADRHSAARGRGW